MPGRADDYAQASIAVLPVPRPSPIWFGSRAILALSAALAAGCSTPFHVSNAHVTATPPSYVESAGPACPLQSQPAGDAR